MLVDTGCTHNLAHVDICDQWDRQRLLITAMGGHAVQTLGVGVVTVGRVGGDSVLPVLVVASRPMGVDIITSPLRTASHRLARGDKFIAEAIWAHTRTLVCADRDATTTAHGAHGTRPHPTRAPDRLSRAAASACRRRQWRRQLPGGGGQFAIPQVFYSTSPQFFLQDFKLRGQEQKILWEETNPMIR